MDLIEVRGIRAYGRHGANPGERDAEQPFDVDVRLELDLSAAEQSDDLADTVDYAAMHARVAGVVRSTSYALLERLAAAIFEAIFEDERVARAHVRIAKPHLLDGATPSVALLRDNPRRPAR